MIKADIYFVGPLLYFACFTLIFLLSCTVNSALAGQSQYDDEFSIFYSDICPKPDNSYGTNQSCVLVRKGFFFPSDLAIGRDNNIYVLNPQESSVYHFSGNGTFLSKWGRPGSGDGEFRYPSGITTDGRGYVYVSDYANNEIQKFTSNGTFVTKWGSHGLANGEFSSLMDVAADPSGNVFTVEMGEAAGASRIQKFTSNGTFVTKWGSMCWINDIFYGKNGCTDPDGEGPLSLGDGQFNIAKGIAVDPSGFVYVVDQRNSRIQKFTNNGTFVTKWGSECGRLQLLFFVPGSESCPSAKDDQFMLPNGGIAADSDGFVYVLDQNNNRIQKFNSNGTFVNKWDLSGGVGDLPVTGIPIEKSGVVVGSGGTIYTTFGNDRIQFFSQSK